MKEVFYCDECLNECSEHQYKSFEGLCYKCHEHKPDYYNNSNMNVNEDCIYD